MRAEREGFELDKSHELGLPNSVSPQGDDPLREHDEREAAAAAEMTKAALAAAESVASVHDFLQSSVAKAERLDEELSRMKSQLEVLTKTGDLDTKVAAMRRAIEERAKTREAQDAAD